MPLALSRLSQSRPFFARLAIQDPKDLDSCHHEALRNAVTDASIWVGCFDVTVAQSVRQCARPRGFVLVSRSALSNVNMPIQQYLPNTSKEKRA